MRKREIIAVVGLMVFTLLPIEGAWAQAPPVVNPYPSHDVKMPISSGEIYHNGGKPEMVWSDTIRVTQAEWIRLNFSQLILGNEARESTSSWIRITSLEDDAYHCSMQLQRLNGRTKVPISMEMQFALNCLPFLMAE